MRGLAFLLTVIFCSGIASAAPADQVLAAPRAFLAAFNAADGAKLAALCAPNAPVLDDFAPFVWQGCDAWYKDFLAVSKRLQLTDNKVTIASAPWSRIVNANTAYVVVPTKWTYKDHGKPTTMTGAVWTITLKKVSRTWRISGWAWSDH